MLWVQSAPESEGSKHELMFIFEFRSSKIMYRINLVGMLKANIKHLLKNWNIRYETMLLKLLNLKGILMVPQLKKKFLKGVSIADR